MKVSQAQVQEGKYWSLTSCFYCSTGCTMCCCVMSGWGVGGWTESPLISVNTAVNTGPKNPVWISEVILKRRDFLNNLGFNQTTAKRRLRGPMRGPQLIVPVAPQGLISALTCDNASFSLKMIIKTHQTFMWKVSTACRPYCPTPNSNTWSTTCVFSPSGQS